MLMVWQVSRMAIGAAVHGDICAALDLLLVNFPVVGYLCWRYWVDWVFDF
jgi:hypothetical protein